MAKSQIKIQDGEKWISQMEKVGTNTDKMIRQAVYPAAGYVTDEIKKTLSAIPADDTRATKRNGLRSYQMKDVIASIGIASFKNTNGFIHVKVGFDGYGSKPTHKYPQGIPNAMLARTLETGSKYVNAKPFMRTTANRCREKAIAIMDENISDYIKENVK